MPLNMVSTHIHTPCVVCCLKWWGCFRLCSGPVLMMFAERIGLKWWEWTDHTEALSCMMFAGTVHWKWWGGQVALRPCTYDVCRKNRFEEVGVDRSYSGPVLYDVCRNNVLEVVRWTGCTQAMFWFLPERIGLKWWEWADHIRALSCMMFAGTMRCKWWGGQVALRPCSVMIFAERIGLKWWEWTDHTQALSCMMFAGTMRLKWWGWTGHTQALCCVKTTAASQSGFRPYPPTPKDCWNKW